MAAFAPFITFALRWGGRAAVAVAAALVSKRLVENDWNIPKTFKVLREDVVHSYKFVSDDQYRKLQSASDRLYKKGGEYATFATLLLSLAETISGSNITTAGSALKKVQAVLAAYGAFDARRKKTVDNETEFDIEALMHDALARYMYAKGIELVNNTKVAEMQIGQYISRYYLGLYYIGRSGNHLSAEEVDSRAMDLRHLHHQAGIRKYKGLIDWYQTIGVSYPGELLPLLEDCDLVKTLNVDARYIAYALDQRDETLSFDGILEDILNRFPT